MTDGKICAFTGHREIRKEDMATIGARVGDMIDSLVSLGYTNFRAGGALGFDTVAALKVIEKKAKYPHICLHLFLPCKNQDRGWGESAKTAYAFIKDNANSIWYAGDKYSGGCMQRRNREMINGSDICVAYCIESKPDEVQLNLFNEKPPKKRTAGGTKYTVEYAEKKGIKVINLTENYMG